MLVDGVAQKDSRFYPNGDGSEVILKPKLLAYMVRFLSAKRNMAQPRIVR